MIHQNDPLWLLSLLHRFLKFFLSKTGGRLKVLLSFPSRVTSGKPHLWVVLVLTFQSSSFHTSSMGFKSTDCAGQDICWTTCFSSLLLMCLWQSLLVCFVSLSCMCTNPWLTSRVPVFHVPVCCYSQSDSIWASSGANPPIS